MPTASVDDVFERGKQLIGQTVVLRGNLSAGSVACTLAFCPPGDCCNRCWGWLVVGEPAPNARGVYLRNHPCTGDDSRVCCGIRPAQDVVVSGRLVRGNPLSFAQERFEVTVPYVLEEARICTPAQKPAPYTAGFGPADDSPSTEPISVGHLPEPTLRRVPAPALDADQARRKIEVESFIATQYQGYKGSTNWERYFYLGGPGGVSVDCN